MRNYFFLGIFSRIFEVSTKNPIRMEKIETQLLFSKYVNSKSYIILNVMLVNV